MIQKGKYEPGVALIVAVTAVFGVASWLRLQGVAWDEFAGLHPDERHMLFVALDMIRGLDDTANAGLSLADIWFAAGVSPLDPRLTGHSYVYGEAPLLSLVLIAHTLGESDWFKVMELGRTLTAIVDSFTVLAVFMMTFALARSAAAAVITAVLYAAAPSALQLANFFTVDAWLTAAFAWSGVALLRLHRSSVDGTGGKAAALAAGLFMALAAACKLTGWAIGLPAVIVLVLIALRRGPGRAIATTLIMGAAFVLAFRLANPFSFTGPSLFGLGLSEGFVRDFGALLDIQLMQNHPPNWQWIAGYPIADFLRDFALFGAGPVITICALTSVFFTRRSCIAVALVAAAMFLPLVIFTLVTETSALRYAAPGLPALAAFSGFAIVRLPRPAKLLVILLAGWWGAGAVALHSGPHPRLAASRWLWTQPKGSVLLNETIWDEGLPVPVIRSAGEDRVWPGHEGHFQLENLDITAADDAGKATRIAQMLDRADFLILSSGRQRQMMPRLPAMFPMTSAYYRMLDDGGLCFASIWRADRGFPLPFARFDDSWVQEPWRVYDHPIVEIYARRPCYNPEAARAALLGAL